MCMNTSDYSLWSPFLSSSAVFSFAAVLPGAFILVCLNFMLCSIRTQGWRPVGNGRGTQISQERELNTNVLTLRKGQDITFTALEVDLGLLPSVDLTHMPTLMKPFPNAYKISRVTPSEGASPACVTSCSELFVSLSYHFFALHFPFCSFPCFPLLLCENRGGGNPFCHFFF